MRQWRFLILEILFLTAIPSGGFAQESPSEPAASVVPLETYPLPLGTQFERWETGNPQTAAVGKKIIYSNTRSLLAVNSGTSRVTDDISTVAASGCRVMRYEFPVTGKVNPAGAGGPYTVDFALYNTCPGSVPGANPVIPGTQGQAVFPDDAPRLISFSLSGTGISIPQNVWFGVKFNRSNAGVLVGAPAETGVSCDLFDFPGFPCSGAIGGFPLNPHASFNLRLFGDAACTDAFDGYKNIRASGPIFNLGQDATLVDDIHLGVPSCQMIGYEVAVKGLGFFQFDMRRNCDGSIITGTEKVYNGTGNTAQIARFGVSSPVELPQDFFFATRVNSAQAGIVVSGVQACVGSTEDISLLPSGEGECVDTPFPDPVIRDGVNLTIFCAGSPPVGACCDMIFGRCAGGPEDGNECDSRYSPFCPAPGTCEVGCREVPQMNCPWPWPQWSSPDQPAWVEGAACDPDPFPFTCGIAACCRPDDLCQNLTQNACEAVEPLDRPRQWQRGRYCGVDGQYCPFSACLAYEGECTVAHPEPGCEYSPCCDAVCQLDRYCCQVEWDRLCVQHAGELCWFDLGNDECAERYYPGAMLVDSDSTTYFSNRFASDKATDPEFCCGAEGGPVFGKGSVWFKFVASDSSARISTCNSDLAGDSLINVFQVTGPPPNPEACPQLSLIGCSDDAESCEGNAHAEVCVGDLTVGDTYYVMVGSKSADAQGPHELQLRPPCVDQPVWIRDDCNANALPDGCEIGRGAGTDCNEDVLLDQCEIAAGTSLDCNADFIPDECSDALQTLWPDAPSDSFGGTLALEDDLLLIGEPYVDRDAWPRVGSAQLYRRVNLTWQREAKFSLSGAESSFVWPSVALSNGDALVLEVEPAPPQPGTGVRGSVLVFANEGGQWTQRPALVVEDPSQNADLSQLVAARDLVAVSARPDVDSYYLPSAIVYVLRREGLGWIQEAKIRTPSEYEDLFGYALSLDQDRLAIGAPHAAGSDCWPAGAVYIFRRQGTQWIEETKLSNDCGIYYFGQSLDLRGNLLAVAADTRVFVFRRTASGWVEDGSVAYSAYYPSQSLAFINDGMVLVGTSDAVGGASPARIFQRLATGIWQELTSLPAWPYSPSGAFNSSVGAEQDIAVVGTNRWYNEPSSPVLVFPIPGGDCNENGVTDGCDIRDGVSADCNVNQVPDECDVLPPADFDFDRDVDLRDVGALQRCFTGAGGMVADPCCTRFELQGRDSDVDILDYAVMAPLLTGP